MPSKPAQQQSLVSPGPVCGRLLATVKPADNKPKTVATPASAGLATIPKPVKAVARVADDSPAESEPRPTAEM